MKNDIELFFHCLECIEEKPSNLSPREWGSIEAGWTIKGFQIWCKRHDKNVLNISFDGQKVVDLEDVENNGEFPGE